MISTGDISNIFGFLGGLGMFLYGMSIMADGMQKTAGSRMSSFLGMLTNNRLLAVLLGALITAIIQSSGATTVMVVGFVSVSGCGSDYGGQYWNYHHGMDCVHESAWGCV